MLQLTLVRLSWMNRKTGLRYSFTTGVVGLAVDALYPYMGPTQLIIPTPAFVPPNLPIIAFFRSFFLFLGFFLGLITFILVSMFLELHSLFSSFISSIREFLFAHAVYTHRNAFKTNVFTGQRRRFHSSSIMTSGLSRHNTHPSVPANLSQNDTRPYWVLGESLPEATQFLYDLPSIHSANFLEELLSFLNQICTHPDSRFNILVECRLEGNRFRSLAPSFHASSGVTLTDLEEHFNSFIENFEAQSGTGEIGPSVLDSRAVITNISSAPHPEARPFSSSPENIQWKQDIKADKKASRRPSVTTQALNNLNTNMDTQFKNLSSTMTSGLKEVVNAIKTQPTVQTPPHSSSPLGLNWTPILHALVGGVASSLGATVQFPTNSSLSPSVTPTSPEETTPSLTPSVVSPTTPISQAQVNLEPLLSRLEKIETSLSSVNSRFSKLESSLNTLANAQTEAQTQITFLASSLNQTNSNVNSISSSVNTLVGNLNSLVQAITPPSSDNSTGGNSSTNGGGGTSSAPSTPVAPNIVSDNDQGNSSKNSPLKLPTTLPEITPLKPADKNMVFERKICTADLEALILPDGKNYVYMAAWYNGSDYQIYNINQFSSQDSFLKAFWKNLIQNNEGRTCYFHNFGGYDSILSLPQLLDFDPNLEFKPIMKDGELISIEVKRGTTHLISIKDSIRILPGALGKLAKDWKVETQKDHFPHYFWNENLKSTLTYVGEIPPYNCFEPKRTSSSDYELMVQEFSSKTWSFLEVSRQYILGDCVALFQILIKFFGTLNDQFPINPLKVLSAPSAAFKIWRTAQLPLLLNEENVSVYDFSNTEVDKLFRTSYCGGIVDVYRPHLLGKGYYYDVNSLYPTAMIKTMPVGLPKIISPSEYSNSFFGFVDATVIAPDPSTYAGYVGLLPIKHQGKLICPAGTFRGLFFSEEFNFALSNGYKIKTIHQLYAFQRGNNTFRDLIEKLNSMKIEAQLNNQPTIRNIAKLLMNSMYGRFGMHTDVTQTSILSTDQIAEYTKVFTVLSQIVFGNRSLIHYSLNPTASLGEGKKHKLIRKFLKGVPSNTNVAIASAVTSYSRMLINQHKLTALNQGLNIYYSDTDSLVVDGVLPSHLLDNAELGKLKLEHEIKEGIFVMPKIYYLETKEEKVVTKAKGFPGKLTKEQYLSLLQGETVTGLSVTKWFRSMKDSSVQIQRSLPYHIRFNFNKRNQVLENGLWTNTKPIILNS